MKMKKLEYQSPETEIFEIKSQLALLASSGEDAPGTDDPIDL